MSNIFSKKQKYHLRVLAEQCHQDELEEAMGELYEDFQKWGGKDISVFDLNDRLHEFHDGISRELYKRYVMLDPEFSVAYALNNGLLSEDEIGEDLVKLLGKKVIKNLNIQNTINIPKNNSEWLAEVKEAYEAALNEFERGELDILEKEALYIVAPLFAAKNRGIVDEEVIDEMCEHTQENAEQDFANDEESISEFKFHFVIAYIHSHVSPGLLPEMEADRVMEYVNDQWQLFG